MPRLPDSRLRKNRERRSPERRAHLKLKNFTEYVDSIGELVESRGSIAPSEWRDRLAVCLDGEPHRVLQQQVPQLELRQQGAYFTGPKFAQRVATAAIDGSEVAVYHDPACGAGDLLLAIARRLPLQPDFPATLKAWGVQLSGCDLSADFVRLAKARLTLLAAQRCRVRPPLDSAASDDVFPNIVVANSLNSSRGWAGGNVIVMNPPFGYTSAPTDCTWATGRVNTAALFVDRAIHEVSDGVRIVALLPDVLRSGSRYVAWREAMQESGCVTRETPLGLFDPWADVDVYLFHFEKKTCQHSSCEARPTKKPTFGVGKRFRVHVGPVVPHRHAEEGPSVRYIHARSIPAWSECADLQETRRFSGRVFDPPFVTVRRTSRPDGGRRAVATLVLGTDPVAVENHLIVMLPRDGEVETCRQLVRRLRSARTDAWLDSRLRCRHLTTGALAEMPWWRKP